MVVELAVPFVVFVGLEVVFLVQFDKCAGIHQFLEDVWDVFSELRAVVC